MAIKLTSSKGVPRSWLDGPDVQVGDMLSVESSSMVNAQTVPALTQSPMTLLPPTGVAPDDQWLVKARAYAVPAVSGFVALNGSMPLLIRLAAAAVAFTSISKSVRASDGRSRSAGALGDCGCGCGGAGGCG